MIDKKDRRRLQLCIVWLPHVAPKQRQKFLIKKTTSLCTAMFPWIVLLNSSIRAIRFYPVPYELLTRNLWESYWSVLQINYQINGLAGNMFIIWPCHKSSIWAALPSNKELYFIAGMTLSSFILNSIYFIGWHKMKQAQNWNCKTNYCAFTNWEGAM